MAKTSTIEARLENRLNSLTPVVLSVFRMVIGFLFACHGASVLFAWPVNFGMGTPAFGAWPGWFAGAIELLVGILVFTGLATRAAAFIGSGQMAVAYFWQHQPKALLPLANHGEPAVLFCFALFLLVFTGGGVIALDTLRKN
ncbi:DoxX family protein [Mycobacterium sp. OTB74]|jgi:putative oxidoreductase|uniref:DoxX family protein n=1 Tax=Mycobacterium sp. OTB74 TaxID=1853452 RepID=UPI0024748513|nr:DoxX family protein [Mycobacterium sp. OTB74]MDH6246004.1 putative oxidoreductase [Mycobacterium sp. OTB74]